MQTNKKNLYFFMILSFATAGTVPLLYSFTPIYFERIGFNQFQIGLLTALGPLCCIIIQPLSGIMADRAKYKNNVLQAIYIGVTVTTFAMILSEDYYYIFIVILIQSVFQAGMVSLNETITLEYLEKTPWSYGIVRIFGSGGFALFSMLLGVFSGYYMKSIFWVTGVFGLLCILIMLKIPRIKGHQSDGKKAPYTKLFSIPNLMSYILVHIIIQATLSFHAVFFPVYLKELGGSDNLYGIILFFQTLCEIPFLIWGDKIIERLGITRVLMFSSIISAVRLILVFLVTNPLLTLPINLLHGGTYIVFTYTLAIYINKEAPDELKASGQAFNNLTALGAGRMAGSFLGGILCQLYGTRQAYFFASLISVLGVLAFSLMIQYNKKKVVEKNSCLS